MNRHTQTVRPDPLSVLVHIPKTAGSTVNDALLDAFARRHNPAVWRLARSVLPQGIRGNPVAVRHLGRHLARGCSHVGTYLDRSDLFDRHLSRSDWVSGHIPRDTFDAHLARIGRPGRFATVLRDPIDQVASHYQWWIEIHHRGPLRYWRYAPFWRDLSRRIRATDNADPTAIIPILSLHHTLFLNIQTTYVAGSRDRLTEVEAKAALDRFAAVGIGSDITPVVRALTGQDHDRVAHVNASRSRFDRAVFRTPEMQAFLHDHHAADLVLYEVAKKRAGRQTG